MKKRALVIEDAEDIQTLLKLELELLGYSIECVGDGIEGVKAALENDYAFILLDIELPSLEGTEVCKRIRMQKRDVPIIMLTSKSDAINKVLLLELGADDYVTKPFDLAELKARINAVVRRTSQGGNASAVSKKQGTLVVGELAIDFDRHRVIRRDEQLEITAREFEILALLASERGRPVTRDRINDELYGYMNESYEKSINSHIARLRAKLEDDPDNPKYLVTVRGVGYKMPEDDEF